MSWNWKNDASPSSVVVVAAAAIAAVSSPSANGSVSPSIGTASFSGCATLSTKTPVEATRQLEAAAEVVWMLVLRSRRVLERTYSVCYWPGALAALSTFGGLPPQPACGTRDPGFGFTIAHHRTTYSSSSRHFCATESSSAPKPLAIHRLALANYSASSEAEMLQMRCQRKDAAKRQQRRRKREDVTAKEEGRDEQYDYLLGE